MSNKKTFRVIEILNKKELIINYGYEDGAREGDKIIISEIGPEVKDPSTNEILGTIDIIKGDLEIYKVYQRFSICRDITYTESSINSIIHPFGSDTKTIANTNYLNIDEKEITNRWPKPIPPIKVGDEIKLKKY